MMKILVAAQTMLLFAAGCAFFPKANIGESRRPESSEPQQVVVPEALEVPPVVVDPRSEPHKPIEYSSLADQYIPSEKPIEGELIRGFRVQLFTTKSTAAADSFATKASGALDVKVYTVYEPPYYKVRAGDFVDQFEAAEAEKKIKSKGFETFIVRDIISTGGED